MSGMMVVILALVIVAGVKTKAENAGFHIADDTENSYEQQVAGQIPHRIPVRKSGRRVWSLMREKSICIIQISKPTS